MFLNILYEEMVKLKKVFSVLLILVLVSLVGTSVASAEEHISNIEVNPYEEITGSEIDVKGDDGIGTQATYKRYWKLLNYNPSSSLKKAYSVGISEADLKQDDIEVSVRTYDKNGREVNHQKRSKWNNTYVEAKAKAVTKPANYYSKSNHYFKRGTGSIERSLTNKKWPNL